MTKSKAFFILSTSFLSGVFAASFFQIEKYLLHIIVLAGISIFLINYRNKKFIVASAAVLFLALGIWRGNVAYDLAKNNPANQRLGSAEFVGVNSKETETSEKIQKVVVSAEFKKHSSKLVYWNRFFGGSSEKILINAPVYPAYRYGDELKVSCILQKPENFSENFDYQMYLAKDGIYRVCSRPEITLLARNRGNEVYSAILAIKNKFEVKLSAIFPDPEGAYLKGLLLGGSKRMPRDLTEAFQRTGTTHTVAVSGYNVAIVAAFLMWLGIWLGFWRQQVFSFAVLGIIFFILMTGAPSSAVRAGIMGSLVIWAMKEGRLANSMNAILLAAGAMLLINPLLLRYDAGFQLSFLATIGIVQLSPILEKIWKGRPPKLVQETILLTMSAMIFVLPIILNSFEKLSLVSPIANFFILPAIPYIMGTGFAAGIAGFIFVPLGKLIGFVPYILLKIELLAVQWMANLSWASVEIKNFGWKHVLVYYIILTGTLCFLKEKSRKIPRLFSNRQVFPPCFHNTLSRENDE